MCKRCKWIISCNSANKLTLVKKLEFFCYDQESADNRSVLVSSVLVYYALCMNQKVGKRCYEHKVSEAKTTKNGGNEVSWGMKRLG
jgi:hypothetical protein